MKKAYYDIDGYIQTFPKETQKLLKRIRTAIRKAAPGAEEGISYGMPVFKINGKPLVYFAAFKDHIGFMPCLPDIPNLPINWQNTNTEKDPFNSHSTIHCPLT